MFLAVFFLNLFFADAQAFYLIVQCQVITKRMINSSKISLLLPRTTESLPFCRSAQKFNSNNKENAQTPMTLQRKQRVKFKRLAFKIIIASKTTLKIEFEKVIKLELFLTSACSDYQKFIKQKKTLFFSRASYELD